MDEKGYIKFNCNWIPSGPVEQGMILDINFWRNEMYKKGWIGVYPNGIGFGNISIRLSEKSFLISGTDTGKFKFLNNSHYTIVTGYDHNKNTLTCKGPLKASSESLTHAALYKSSPDTNAVIHIHNRALWEKLKDVEPTTSVHVAYGTPEMAREIIKLLRSEEFNIKKIIIMAGHEEGILSFGKTLSEAGGYLLSS